MFPPLSRASRRAIKKLPGERSGVNGVVIRDRSTDVASFFPARSETAKLTTLLVGFTETEIVYFSPSQTGTTSFHVPAAALPAALFQVDANSSPFGMLVCGGRAGPMKTPCEQ